MSGNLTLTWEVDDHEVGGINLLGERIDVLLKELLEDTAEYTADRMRAHAPEKTGNLHRLIDSTRATRSSEGGFEAIAGARPDEEKRVAGRPSPLVFGNTGLGSDPADYPVFVEAGTRDVTLMPGHFMVFEIDGKVIRTSHVKGQEGEHYTQQAYEEALATMPARLEKMRTQL